MRYTVILEQEADGGYVATVPVLPGCVSQGDTRDEVMKNIHEAADLYIEDCTLLVTRSHRSGKRVLRAQDRHPPVKLPTGISGRELVKALVRVGFVGNRQKVATSSLVRRENPYARSLSRITNEFVLELCGRF